MVLTPGSVFRGNRGSRASNDIRMPVPDPIMPAPYGLAAKTFPGFLPGVPLPQLYTEFSGLVRPTATNNDLDRLWSTSVAIYAATNFWAENLGMVKFTLRDENGQEVPSTHWLVQALNKNLSNNLRRSEASLAFRGYSLLYKEPTMNRRISNLRLINFNVYQLDKDTVMGLKGFRIIANAQDYDPVDVDYIPRSEAVYLNLINLLDDFDGTSPAEVAFLHAGVDVETAATAFSFFQNFAIPPLIIQPTADTTARPTTQERNDLASMFRKIVRGALNAGRTIITPVRWDIQRIQQPFGDLGMSELTRNARDSIFLAMGVPIEILMPSQGGYAQAYESRRGWLQTRFKPKVIWYAENFEEQLVKPFYPGWTVEADLSQVPGMREDQDRIVSNLQNQISAGYMDLYTAQRMAGLDPDPALVGLYMVQGIPIPSEEMHDYWQTKLVRYTEPLNPGTKPLDIAAGNSDTSTTAKLDVTVAKPPASGTTKPIPVPQTTKPEKPLGALPPKSLSNGALKELKNWRLIVERKGHAYPFKTKALPKTVEEYGKVCLANTTSTEEAFVKITAYAQDAVKTLIPETDEGYQFWKDHDKLTKEIGYAWLTDYMREVAKVIKPRLRPDITDREIQQVLNTNTRDLTRAWIGTPDKPGPMLKLALAGVTAGQHGLEGGAVNPKRPASGKSDDLVDLKVDWSLLNKEAYDFIKKYLPILIKNVNRETLNTIRKTIQDWTRSGASLKVLQSNIDDIFDDSDRAELIAQTESTRVFAQGAVTRYANAGITQVIFRTSNDSLADNCPICGRLNGQIADINIGFTGGYAGAYLPPMHPGCRCAVKPYLGD